MAFSDLIGDVIEQFDHSATFFAESVLATPPSGDPVTLLADVGTETTREDIRGGKKLTIRTRTITYSTEASLDCMGIAASAPVIDYKMTYGGRQYSVVEVVWISEVSKQAQVRVEHAAEAEGPRPGLRDGPRWH